VLAGLLGLAAIATGQPAAGSFTAGAAVAGFGMVFAGVAPITVQLASTTRAANGLAAAVLGFAFVLSGVGNILGTVDASGLRLVSAWPAWLSPLGWGQQMRPFGGTTGGRSSCPPSPPSSWSARRVCWRPGATLAAA
jgi:putative exporter of polyketide antibiotics